MLKEKNLLKKIQVQTITVIKEKYPLMFDHLDDHLDDPSVTQSHRLILIKKLFNIMLVWDWNIFVDYVMKLLIRT